MRRNPGLTGAGLAVVLALGAAGGFAWQAREAERRRTEEKQKQDDELRAEKQRAAIDKGMVAALAADLPAARGAIAEAEALGTSASELHILRGFVAMYTDDPAGAVREFRAAVELMPERVAPRALLSAAYSLTGDFDTADPVLREAQRMTARTAEDRLFLGVALTGFHQEAAIRELRAAVAARPSNIAQVFLADALWQHAQTTLTTADAEEALEAAETAVRLLPRNPFVEVIAVHAWMTTAAAHERAGRPDRAAPHWEAASRLADMFSGNPDGYAVLDVRSILALCRDGLTPPFPRTQKLRFPAGATAPEIAGIEVAALWRLGEVEKARARVEPLPFTYYTVSLKIGLALERPGGRDEARRVWEACAARPDTPTVRYIAMPWLYAVGDPDRAAAEAARERAAGFPSGFGEYKAEWKFDTQFWENKLSEAEYLRAPMISPGVQCYRAFNVGLRRLGAGDRAGAREAFTRGYRLHVFRGNDWELLATFLIRMNADPEWPRAIPMKKP